MQALLTKQTFILLAIGVLVIGSIVWLERPRDGVVCTAEGTHIYGLSYADERGTCRSLDTFKAPVSVFNVWASWCPFCVEELPDLARLAEEFPEVPVVAINRGESSADAQAFLETLTLNDALHILFDPEDSFYRFIQGFGMPETVFVGEDGTILFHKRGIMSLEEMRDTIKLLTTRVQPNTATHNKSLCLGDGSACSIH